MRARLQSYALTINAYQRKRVFQRDVVAELFIATILRYREGGKFLLHGFVVMPDHVHALITPATDVAVEKCAQLIKGGFSFAVRAEYKGEIWQDGYHAHRVTDDEDFRNQLGYIANNPVRKGRNRNQYEHVHTAEKYSELMDARPES